MQFTFSDLTFAFIVMAGAVTVAWPMWAIDSAIHTLIDEIRRHRGGDASGPDHVDKA